MTHIHAKDLGQRSFGSKQKWNQTDERTEPIGLLYGQPSILMYTDDGSEPATAAAELQLARVIIITCLLYTSDAADE